ncbi:MAG: (2Fe-2S)-binding protein [Vampirovibrionales bacterium]|nr:(2Fe-2S)-binding protein [Vampirovibrionales bacterium]
MSRILFLPTGQSIEIDGVATLRDAAHALGVEVHDRCGGMGACCNCIIEIVAGAEHLNAKTHLEEPVFYLGPNERLSCQCRPTGDITVRPREMPADFGPLGP